MKNLLRVFLFICSGSALLAVTEAAAQTYPQSGVVRMITTSASSPVIPVAGVKVAVGNNVSKATDSDGAFRMNVTRQFNVNGVMPDDEYELALPTRGKTYHQSQNDLDVVVITKAQKEAVSKKVYDKLQSDYKQKIQELQTARDEANARVRALKKAGQDFATMERQRDSLQKLLLDYLNNMDSFEEKFDALSDQLAITDYRSLSEKEQRVYEMQINGDWEGLARFYDEIMHGDMARYLKDAVTFERRASELQQQAEEERKMRFQDALNHIEALKMQHLNDSVSTCYRILTDAAPDNWEYLNAAGKFESKYMANYSQALTYHEQALRTNLVDSLIAESYNSIGVIYGDQGDYARALEQFECALKIFLSLFGENHPGVAASYNSIGWVYSSQGDYSRALEQYAKALKINLSVYGENNPALATNYNNTGFVYFSQGDYIRALEQYEKALRIELLTLGENHPSIALTYNNIGSVYQIQANYPQAMIQYEKALAILLSACVECHPAVATCCNNIGAVYYFQGDFIRALEQFKKSLEIRLSVYGEHHPAVATSYNNIGLVYSSQGKYNRALEQYEKALKIYGDFVPENHPAILKLKRNIEAARSKLQHERI